MKLSALLGTAPSTGGGSAGDGVQLEVGNTLGTNSAFGLFTLGFVQQDGINASAGLTNLINITGPGLMYYIRVLNITSGSTSHRIRLVVDGEEILDQTIVASITGFNLNTGAVPEATHPVIKYNTSFQLQYQSANASSCSVRYQAIKTK